MGRHKYMRLFAQRILHILARLFLFAVASPALPAWSQDGATLGWSYFISAYKEGYVNDPEEACKLTAQNHMSRPLEDMRRHAGTELMYECKYKNYIEGDGQAQWYGSTTFYCKPGYTKRQPGVCVKRPERSAPGPSSGSSGGGSGGDGCTDGPGPCVGNPVVVSSGAKLQKEVDFEGEGSWALRVERTYRTLRETSGGQSAGVGWSFSFDRTFQVGRFPTGGRPSVVAGTRGDGSFFQFEWRSITGKYESSFEKSARLEALTNTYDDWIVTHPDGQIDRFKRFLAADGSPGEFRLVSSHIPSGQAAYYTYDTNLRVRTISDGRGRELGVSWTNASLQQPDVLVESITGPEGTVKYTYYESTHMFRVEFTTLLYKRAYVDESGHEYSQKTYQYGEGPSSYLLVGITDENGKRYATYSYQNGEVTLSEHADGADRHTLMYPDEQTRIVTDPLGTPRTYKIQDFGNGGVITELSQPTSTGTVATMFLHYEDRHLRSRIDFNGNQICFQRDRQRGLEIGRVMGLTSATSCSAVDGNSPLESTSARRVSTRWHPDFPLVTGLAEPNKITTHIYNGQLDADGKLVECAQNGVLPDGRPVAVVCRTIIQPTLDRNGELGFNAQAFGTARTWNYSYDPRGKLITATGQVDAGGNQSSESRTYYQDSSVTHSVGDLATLTNSAGEITNYLEYTAAGLPTKILSPGGKLVTLEYDSRQRVVGITETSGSLVEHSTYDYDTAGLLSGFRSPDGSSLNYTYDQAHRLIRVTDRTGNRLEFDRDAMGNAVREATYDAAGQLTQQVTRSFDVLNRLARVLVGDDQTGISFSYDNNGNLIKSIDQLGRTTSLQYDAYNRLFRQFLPTPSRTSSRHLIDYAYNHSDQLISVTDPRRLITVYKVSPFGELLSVVSPDSGTSVNEVDGSGNLRATKDARGATIEYQYDAAQRLVKAGPNSYEYGAPGTGASGLLARMKDESGESAYVYDAFGRLVSKIGLVGSGNTARRYNVKYSYGANGASNGHMTSITYPSGNRVELSYAIGGGISGLTLIKPDGSPPVTLLSNITRQPFGEVSGWLWGNGPIPDARYWRTFDLAGRVTSYPLGYLGENGVLRTVIHDAAGRIIGTIHAANDSASSLDQKYFYDDLDRLTGFNATGTTQRYIYDLNGNRVSATLGEQTYLTKIDPTSNKLLSTTGPTLVKANMYDEAGNLLSDGVIRYTYDANGRTASSSNGEMTSKYRYNGHGQRVLKSEFASGIPIKNVFYVYDEQGHVLGEYDDRGSVTETVYLGEIPVAVIKSEPQEQTKNGIYFIFADELNTPRVISRSSDKKIVWRWDSADPFGQGEPQQPLGKFAYDLRFPGQIFDQETNTHYNYFRDYDPQSGRYSQSDPIGLAGGPNTYTYVGAAPTMYADPYGLVRCTYAIKAASLTCTSNDGSKTVNMKSGIHSGFEKCKNNPDCSDKERGPVPPDTYNITANTKPGHEGWWAMQSQSWRPGIDGLLYKLGQTRAGFNLHLGSFSLGCITFDKSDPAVNKAYYEISHMFYQDTKSGGNVITVTK
jgi:RHS repeat-associated protein